jgi:hypothetical protein
MLLENDLFPVWEYGGVYRLNVRLRSRFSIYESVLMFTGALYLHCSSANTGNPGQRRR